MLTRHHLSQVAATHRLKGKVLVEAVAKQIELDRRLFQREREDRRAELARLAAEASINASTPLHKEDDDELDDEIKEEPSVADRREAAGAPDIIYVLRDYPSTPEEAADLVGFLDEGGRPDPLLDAVVTVVADDGGGPGGVTWPCPPAPTMAFDYLPLAADMEVDDAARATELRDASGALFPNNAVDSVARLERAPTRVFTNIARNARAAAARRWSRAGRRRRDRRQGRREEKEKEKEKEEGRRGAKGGAAAGRGRR